jgi:ATP-dependent RNA circularization protein (DNA/RNA ligase family)
VIDTTYHKINSIYKRDQDTHKLIIGDYSCESYAYLQDNIWTFTEKVDGTNIRVIAQNGKLSFGGRTDAAQIPKTLLSRLSDLFAQPHANKVSIFECDDVVLYGEGYGAKIQKGGGNYKPDGVDFVLFDVAVGGIFLERDNVDDVAAKLGIQSVPIVGTGTLLDGVQMIIDGFASTWGNFIAEGVVARPAVELLDRRGNRIITKIKVCDF